MEMKSVASADLQMMLYFLHISILAQWKRGLLLKIIKIENME
jgi:hypothetical protein